MKKPIPHNIKAPNTVVKVVDIDEDNIFPNIMETLVIERLNRNKIKNDKKEILVFLIPYVIPTPRESKLADNASIKALNIIVNTSLHNMKLSSRCEEFCDKN